MKKMMTATAVFALMSGAAMAQEAKVGVLMGFTGPIESLTPGMAAGAELAMQEVSDSGALLDGMTLTPVRGDSTCVDAGAATTAAEAILAEDVVAIVGAACSGASTAVANNVAIPQGLVMISPASTSPALTDLEDDGHFFRTAPSDARQGEILANIVKDKGFENAAVTYTNNDYGKGFAESFEAAFEAAGGSIAISAAHEDGKADYSAEVGALAAAGADILVVLGYIDQGGNGIIRNALDTGAFDTFAFGDGMIGDKMGDDFGDEIEGSFGTAAGSEGPEGETFTTMLNEAGTEGTGPYRGESYDAVALFALAMQKAGEATVTPEAIMEVANAPGEQIGVGEIEKGLQLIADGQDVDYQGVTAVEFDDNGDPAGSYLEYEMQGGALEVVGQH
ncbi:ABC transporter substrate-binding protein [Paracoccaceae bacterium GXU_MW_L88]